MLRETIVTVKVIFSVIFKKLIYCLYFYIKHQAAMTQNQDR